MVEHIFVEFRVDKGSSRRETVVGRDLHVVTALHLARGVRRLTGFDMPLLLHINAVVDGVLGMVVVAMGFNLTLFATPESRICQMTPISIWVGASR